MSRAPPGVNEAQYRRALADVRKREKQSSFTVDAAALQSDMAKRFNLPGQQSNKRVSKQTVFRGEKVLCSSCRSYTSSSSECCEFCGYFVMGVSLPAETLAQKRGLVAPTQKPEIMSYTHWDSIEEDLRNKAEPDSLCPICMDGFKQGCEVLLSCSHMFHKACLASFEKFMKNGELNCPICRTKNYQKKLTNIGSQAYRISCAKKIQCVYRGWRARVQFREMRRSYYKSGQGNSGQRKKFYESEFTKIAVRMDRNMDQRHKQVDSILSSTDETLMQSRQLDALFEHMLLLRTGGKPLNSSEGEPSGSSGVDWEELKKLALSRDHLDCAICMSGIHYFSCYPTPHMQNTKRTVLLSCSHLFHEQCIHNFEKFMSRSTPTCPVCRSFYEKKFI